MREQPNITDYPLWQNGHKVYARIAVGGDFLPAMALEGASPHDWRQHAELVRDHFVDIDCAMVNLESPLDCEGLTPAPKIGLGASLYGPGDALQYLDVLKVGLVGMANNHMMDYEAEGIIRTHKALQASGICGVGAPVCIAEQPDVKIVNVKGFKVGIWAAFLNATPGRAGSTAVEPATVEKSQYALRSMDQDVACRIALIHAGLEKTNYPDPYELKQLHLIVQNGFDLVCVSHSHRISGYTSIQSDKRPYPGFCFHGLGSLLSGCIYGELEREGFVAVLGLDDSGRVSALSVRPVYLHGPGWGSVPDAEKRERILNRFLMISRRIEDDSYRSAFYADMRKGMWRRYGRDFKKAFENKGLKGVAAKCLHIRPKHLHRLLNKVLH